MRRSTLIRVWRKAWATCVSTVIEAPVVIETQDLSGGVRLFVQASSGTNPSEFVSAGPRLALALGVSEVTIKQSHALARQFTVDVLWESLLDADTFLPTPLALHPHSWFSPVPVGVDATGELVTVSFEENNFLIAGVPGSGKSVFASSLVCAAVLDPDVSVFGIDAKGGVELSLFEEVLDRLVWDLDDAVTLLQDLNFHMMERYSYMRAQGLRKAPREWRRVVLFIDEVAELTAPGVSRAKEGKVFSDLLRQLVSKGRAAGICVSLATQKPSSDVIDTSIRDLISTRVAFRCTTNQASDTILGSGRASAGESAMSIPASSRGRGLLINEDTGTATRFRSFYVTDHDVNKLVNIALTRRVIGYGE